MDQWIEYNGRYGRFEGFHKPYIRVRWLDPLTAFRDSDIELFWSSRIVWLGTEPLFGPVLAAAYLGRKRQRIYQMNQEGLFGTVRHPLLVTPHELDAAMDCIRGYSMALTRGANTTHEPAPDTQAVQHDGCAHSTCGRNT